jgi:S1-C subfamily serine protease
MGSRPAIGRRFAPGLLIGALLLVAACTMPLTNSPPSGHGTEAAAGYEGVVSTVSPSIVLIESSGGLGSGVVFDADGDIVTNDHVLGSATSFRVTTADGKMYTASLVGGFAPSDIAVIKASGASLHPAAFANSNNLRVGQIVLAMGNPLGLQSSVSDGVVSAVGRNVTEPNGAVIPNMVQTSAAINPGNSGGGLVNLQSKVIGMPTLGAIDPQIGSAVPGIGFALSSNTVTDFANQIIKNGRVVNTHRAYLGLQLGDLTGATGVVVLGVARSGPSATAGVQVGDIIVSINGKPTQSTPAVAQRLADLSPGDTATLTIKRNGQVMSVKVTLGELPS